MITKTTILSIITISVTLLTLIPLSTIRHFLNIYTFWLMHAIVSIDIYINFVCISLSYKCFNACYNILCGPLDRRCRGLWLNCAIQNARARDRLSLSIILTPGQIHHH